MSERPFSERTYASPFGRYQPGGDVGPPDNDVLIGREGQRRYLIDLLFRMGRRGAFLVTGHRGTGKSIFVDHCLRVHREEVFERFLNSNVGRATFWDRFGLLAIGFLLLLALSMLSQLLDLLTLGLDDPSTTIQPLNWLLIAPIVLIFLYPLLYARDVISAVLHYCRPSPDTHKIAILRTLSIGASLIAFGWYTLSSCKHRNPTLGLFFLFIALALLFVAVRCSHKLSPTTTEPDYESPIVRRIGTILLLSLKIFLCILASMHLLHPFLIRLGQRHQLFGIAQGLCPQSLLLSTASDELGWIAMLTLCLVVLFTLEYGWIVRPLLEERLRAINPSGKPCAGQLREETLYRLSKLTLPWITMNAWLPTLTININLGFEKLEHRRVVHTMLLVLHSKYKRLFTSWASAPTNVLRILALMLLLAFTNFFGDRLFELPLQIRQSETEAEPSQPLQDRTVVIVAERGKGTEALKVLETLASPVPSEPYSELCKAFSREQNGPPITNVLCKVIGGEAIVKILYHNFLDSQTPSGDHLLFALALPYRHTPWPRYTPMSDQGKTGRIYFLQQGTHFAVYHVILSILLFFTGRWLLRRIPIFPYAATAQRIEEALDFLSARTTITSKRNLFEGVPFIPGYSERTFQTDREQGDPRTIEALFLQILEDIQTSRLRLSGSRNQRINLPTPEITFVFDELDKLGTRVDVDEGSAGSGTSDNFIHAERKRSQDLNKLLADMKNLLSSAPARFIFIGGRNLHDEWLSEQISRQPLLTNIFNAEVYLPSLLSDFPWSTKEEKKLEVNIELYLRQQKKRAEAVFEKTKSKVRRPFLLLPSESSYRELFVGRPAQPLGLKFIDTATGDNNAHLQKYLTRDFLQFLAYRSLGNPRRLKELVGSFVRPADRLIDAKNDAAKNALRGCDDVLAFGDTERFRVQLIARIYRHLDQAFEHKLVNRDDKLVVSLFYISDFILKFHRRAFSWGNLERVDELVHIHRAPDLREILEALVGQWTERFLHPIRNGMYDFRFRSDLAREIEYISRHSPAEMAAFNFTLDESQALKAMYTANIAHLREKSGHVPIDMIAGLGELHEFDQEFEDARVYYWRAIALLDEQLTSIAGPLVFREDDGPKDAADSSAVLASFVASARGKRLNRHFLSWGVSRLRLMLQIGMTFEQTRNFERASIEYRNANVLARALRASMLASNRELAVSHGSSGDGTAHPLKHLNILFQPALAEAWVAEKIVTGAIDTGISLIERELWTLRCELPFASSLRVKGSENPRDTPASSFSLIIAELHNKAADLFFFKGRQAATLPFLEKMVDDPEQKQKGREGYLLRAHYHYAVALHDLRRLVADRRDSSTKNLGACFQDETSSWPTIDEGSWPDLIYRSTGGALNDLAEATLGRVSLYKLLCAAPRAAAPSLNAVGKARDSTVTALTLWMESIEAKDEDEDEDKFKFNFDLPDGDVRNLNSWFGRWPTANDTLRPGSAYQPLITLKGKDYEDDWTRLIVALQLKLAGSRLLQSGGYLESAAHELLGVCEIATNYLWWGLMVRKLLAWSPAPERGPLSQIQKLSKPLKTPTWPMYLANFALFSLQKASHLFRLGRKAEVEPTRSYLIGNQIPVAQLLLTCSLGLAFTRWEPIPTSRRDTFLSGISKLLDEWRIHHTQPLNQVGLRSLLRGALVRHSYPMVNRLHGLKVLIDEQLLTERPADNLKESIKELQRLTTELAAPMHFTPLHSGITYALAYCLWRRRRPKDEEFIKMVRAAAQRDLEVSEEMFSLRRAYYENISDLYYLYDDFNDRQIHLSYGILMAGAEINGLFRYLVTVEDPEIAPPNHPSPAKRSSKACPKISNAARSVGSSGRRGRWTSGWFSSSSFLSSISPRRSRSPSQVSSSRPLGRVGSSDWRAWLSWKLGWKRFTMTGPR